MRHLKWTSFVWFLIFLIFFGPMGCVSHKMYRDISVWDYPDYVLSFIEFDDQGEVWSPRQVLAIQDRIRQANQGPDGAIVILFAHGWNNDASPHNERDGTLAGFKIALERLARYVHETTPGKQVFGIYLSWRGKSIYGPLKMATFFTRQRAATRVAGSSGMALLSQIMLDSKSHPNSRLMIVGHSFGGQIIERIIQQGLASNLYSLQQGPLPPTADLCVLINPASPAIHAKQVIDLLRWKQLSLERRAPDGRTWDAPLLVSITSRGDWATRYAFPAGSVLGLLSSRFRSYGTEFCAPVEQQRYFYTRTAGHTPQLHSHDVKIRPIRDDDSSFELLENGFQFAGEQSIIQVTRRSHAFNDTPYWVLRVPEEISSGHSDTWNPNLMMFLEASLRATGAFVADTAVYAVKTGDRVPVLVVGDGKLMVYVDVSRRVYALTEDQDSFRLIGCIPEDIDLANMVGFDFKDSRLWIACSDPHPLKEEHWRSRVYEFLCADNHFTLLSTHKLKQDGKILHAVFDLKSQTLYSLDHSNLASWRLDESHPRPQYPHDFDVPEDPIDMVLDPLEGRLMVLDGASAKLESWDLNSGGIEEVFQFPFHPSTLEMNLDAINGRLLLSDISNNQLLMMTRQYGEWQNPRRWAAERFFENPSAIYLCREGNVWIGDSQTFTLVKMSDDGLVIEEY